MHVALKQREVAFVAKDRIYAEKWGLTSILLLYVY